MKNLINIDMEEKILDKMLQPYKFAIKILGFLLVLSVIGNIYLTTRQVNITFTANKNTESNINQRN